MSPINLRTSVLKCKFDEEIRRISMLVDEISYNDLFSTINRIFAHKIKSDTNIQIKYIDSDGDAVCLESDEDLKLAIVDTCELKLIIGVAPPFKSLPTKLGCLNELFQNFCKDIEKLLAASDSQAGNQLEVMSKCKNEGMQKQTKSLSKAEVEQFLIQPAETEIPPPLPKR